jgi:hypothetical protein
MSCSASVRHTSGGLHERIVRFYNVLLQTRREWLRLRGSFHGTGNTVGRTQRWCSIFEWAERGFLGNFEGILQSDGYAAYDHVGGPKILWRTESGPRRLELFAHATDFCGSAPTANAKCSY